MGRSVATSPLRVSVLLKEATSDCAAGIVNVVVQLVTTMAAVMFSTKKFNMKTCGLRTCRTTRQVGAGRARVVKVTGSERGERLPLGSKATTTTVYVVPG